LTSTNEKLIECLLSGSATGSSRPHGEEIGVAFYIGERVRDGHLAAQRGVGRIELDYFDNLLVSSRASRSGRETSHPAYAYSAKSSPRLARGG
jgi:hypothetical protein